MGQQNKDYLVSIYVNDSDFDHRTINHRIDKASEAYLNGFLTAMEKVYGEEKVEYNIVE